MHTKSGKKKSADNGPRVFEEDFLYLTLHAYDQIQVSLTAVHAKKPVAKVDSEIERKMTSVTEYRKLNVVKTNVWMQKNAFNAT